jgi:hypothetical protein
MLLKYRVAYRARSRLTISEEDKGEGRFPVAKLKSTKVILKLHGEVATSVGNRVIRLKVTHHFVGLLVFNEPPVFKLSHSAVVEDGAVTGDRRIISKLTESDEELQLIVSAMTSVSKGD